MTNVITFPDPTGLFPKRIHTSVSISEPDEEEEAPARRCNGRSMHTFLFRSLSAILEADDADLVRDVCLDLHKAEVKLKKVRQRLQGVQEQAAAQVRTLTAADTKLTAAIVAALLSTLGKNEMPAPIPSKAQSATAGRSREAVKAVNKEGTGSGPRLRSILLAFERSI